MESRPDRTKQADEEMQRIGVRNYEFFFALEGENPFHSFCRSQHAILQRFVESGAEECLILEDDVVFQDLSYIKEAKAELPEDWLVWHLGGNVTDGVAGMLENQPEPYSEHNVRLKCAWTSQAIAYRRPIAEMIIMDYDPETRDMYDDWLSRNVLRTNPCFMIRPTVAWQRPGKSELWGRETDYTGAWEGTDRKLAAL